MIERGYIQKCEDLRELEDYVRQFHGMSKRQWVEFAHIWRKLSREYYLKKQESGALTPDSRNNNAPLYTKGNNNANRTY